jgi:tetratricopeptide (TPR) repeat protein
VISVSAPQPQTHSRSGWLCADHADDDELRCYVSWLRSNDAYWAEEYVSAAGLARSGRQYARHEGDLLRLISQEARAHAATGDVSEAKAVLAQTLRLRDRVAAAPQTRGVLGFAVGKAAYYSSEVRLALGDSENARLAAADAAEGLELLSADGDSKHSVELRAAARLDLVAARLRLDDLDGAVHHLDQAMGVPAQSRTVPILGRVGATDTVLGSDRFSDAAGVPEVRERIAIFTAYGAAVDLPQATDGIPG